MTHNAYISGISVYDCDLIKIVKSNDGKSITIRFGNQPDSTKPYLTVFSWTDEPIEIEISTAEPKENEQPAEATEAA